jgi:DNA-binding beta-propeller fold protein YncE
MRVPTLILFVLTACSGSAQEGTPPPGLRGFRVDPAWPKKPADVTWGECSGVAVDAKDNVWLFTRTAPFLQVYASDGTPLKVWNDLEHKRAHHIRIDPEGNVWLTDVGLHTVRKYTPEGKLLLSLGTPGVPGNDGAHFNMPTDMAITPAGDVFISDGYGNSRVAHFDKAGKFVKAWGKKGSAPGEFNLPHSIVLDSKGRLYVAERNNSRIQVFEQSGAFVAEWRDILSPWGLCMTSQDEIWACGPSCAVTANAGGNTAIPPRDQVLVRFDTTGRVLQLWTFPLGIDGQEKPGELNWIHALAVDSKGNLHCTDIRGKRLQRFIPVVTR